MRLLALLLVCGTISAETEAPGVQLLKRVAAKYRELDSLVVIGNATRPLADGGTFQVKVQRGYASRKLVPSDAPLPFVDAAAVYKGGPNPAFLIFGEIADAAVEAKILRTETGTAGGGSKSFDVLAVRYEDQTHNAAGEPVL